MAEMAFDAFCDVVADAVEFAMDMDIDGEEEDCFLCLVLQAATTFAPEKYAIAYIQERGWVDEHVTTVLGLIREAESEERFVAEWEVGTPCFATLVGDFYRIEDDDYFNQARVAWLRAGCPKFWEQQDDL